MFKLFGFLFLISVLMFFAGVIGRVGVGGLSDLDSNAASAMGLLVVFSFLLLSFSSFSEVGGIIQSISNGIPYVDNISDYGSLRNVFKSAPLEAAKSFFDVVLLSAIINILSLVPSTSGSAVGKFMVKCFTRIVLALISIAILNYVVKNTGAYQAVVGVIGGGISAISVGTIPLAIIALIKKNKFALVGVVGAMIVFSRTKIASILRSSFMESIAFVGGIAIIEYKFGSIANGVSSIAYIITVFAPIVIMIIGICMILKSALRF